MYKLCKTEQSAARQRQISQRLLQAMLMQRYEDISVSELCQQIGIPRKAFYRYFGSKDGALEALLDQTLIEFSQSPVGGVKKREGAASELRRYFEFWYQRKDLLDALERSGLISTLAERTMQHALNEGLMPRYLKTLEPNLQIMALSFTVSGLLAMVQRWHRGGFRETPEEMARTAAVMIAASPDKR